MKLSNIFPKYYFYLRKKNFAMKKPRPHTVHMSRCLMYSGYKKKLDLD